MGGSCNCLTLSRSVCLIHLGGLIPLSGLYLHLSAEIGDEFEMNFLSSGNLILGSGACVMGVEN